jgi:hypothetical protein
LEIVSLLLLLVDLLFVVRLEVSDGVFEEVLALLDFGNFDLEGLVLGIQVD